MNGLRPEEMKTIKAMSEGDWRILIWSGQLEIRRRQALGDKIRWFIATTVGIIAIGRFVQIMFPDVVPLP